MKVIVLVVMMVVLLMMKRMKRMMEEGVLPLLVHLEFSVFVFCRL